MTHTYSTDTDYTLLINRLQELHRSVTGIRYAPALAAYPTVMDTANLPAVLTWIGPEQFSQKGGGWKWARATASVFLFLEPLGQNDIPSRAAQAATVLSALRAAYIDAANIPLAEPGDNAGAYQLTLESSPGDGHTHGGIEANLGFAGAAYYGARLQVTVTMQWA
jgi:hypothetical protein